MTILSNTFPSPDNDASHPIHCFIEVQITNSTKALRYSVGPKLQLLQDAVENDDLL